MAPGKPFNKKVPKRAPGKPITNFLKVNHLGLIYFNEKNFYSMTFNSGSEKVGTSSRILVEITLLSRIFKNNSTLDQHTYYPKYYCTFN